MTSNTIARLALLVVETIVVAVEVLGQKIWMLRLPPLERIGLERVGLEHDQDVAPSTPSTPNRRVCIVTGPTSGIGKEIATEMHRRGYKVILACRNRLKGAQLAAELVELQQHSNSSQPRIPPTVQVLDVSSLESVRKFEKEWSTSVRLPVHALINNAGIFSMSAPRTETSDGFESHMGTNHLGHFLLTELMLPWLKKARQETGRPARVVNVSSKLHRMGQVRTDDPHFLKGGSFNSLAAYAQSKLAQVMFAKEFSRRYDGVVRCVSVHPGEVLTDVVRSLPGTMQRMYRLIMQLFLLTPAQGTNFFVKLVDPAVDPGCSDLVIFLVY
jgi:retinol dehydrogenase-12